MKRIGLGVIGLGLMGRELASAVARWPHLPDLPAIMFAGFGVAVANAADEVKANADYVTTRPGGSGAVRGAEPA